MPGRLIQAPVGSAGGWVCLARSARDWRRRRTPARANARRGVRLHDHSGPRLAPSARCRSGGRARRNSHQLSGADLLPQEGAADAESHRYTQQSRPPHRQLRRATETAAAAGPLNSRSNPSSATSSRLLVRRSNSAASSSNLVRTTYGLLWKRELSKSEIAHRQDISRDTISTVDLSQVVIPVSP